MEGRKDFIDDFRPPKRKIYLFPNFSATNRRNFFLASTSPGAATKKLIEILFFFLCGHLAHIQDEVCRVFRILFRLAGTLTTLSLTTLSLYFFLLH